MTEVLAGTADAQGIAREQIDRIKKHWESFWFEIKDFYDNERWKPLGYKSFTACVKAEFDIGQAHAYRLIDAATIRAELQIIQLDKPTEHLSEGQIRELKVLPPEERAALVTSTDIAQMTAREIRDVVQARQKQELVDLGAVPAGDGAVMAWHSPERAPAAPAPPPPDSVQTFQCPSCDRTFPFDPWHCPGCGSHWTLFVDVCNQCRKFGPNGPTESGQEQAMAMTVQAQFYEVWDAIKGRLLPLVQQINHLEDVYGRSPAGVPEWLTVLCDAVRIEGDASPLVIWGET